MNESDPVVGGTNAVPDARRRSLGLALAAAPFLCLNPAGARAQDYPSQPLKWIVPYPAGGGSDVIARTIAGALKDHLGQTVLVDNRPGAGTVIGTQAMLSAAADGYTVSTADIGTLAYNPSLYTKLPYDIQRSFTYIGGLGRVGFVLVTREGLGIGSLKELVTQAQSQPGRLSYASAGLGSPHHVSMELLQQTLQIKLLHVPYKGGAPALQDLLAGQVDLMMLDVPGGLSAMKSGKLKLLGASTARRVPQLPEVPTLSELGVNGFQAYSWQALITSAAAPVAAVRRLSADLTKALGDAAVQRRFAEMGIEAIPMTGEGTAQLASSEAARWGEVIRRAGIKLD